MQVTDLPVVIVEIDGDVIRVPYIVGIDADVIEPPIVPRMGVGPD
jgi:hypothetical protein